MFNIAVLGEIARAGDQQLAGATVVLHDQTRVFVDPLAKSQGQIDAFIELKMVAVMRYEMTPHPVEFDMYYSS